MEGFRSGYVSLTGRPNVGKSTLLNAIVGEKVAIVSPKPQTTRNRIMAVKNLANAQIVFLDTPGIHKPKHRLGQMMVAEARSSAAEVDLILLLVEPEAPGAGDRLIIEALKALDKPVFLVVNKADSVRKPAILPVIDAYVKLYPFKEVIPVSALKGDGIDLLLQQIVGMLPEGPRYYPEDVVTDQMERFMASEIIREKLMHNTGDEVPYSVAVDIASWSEREDGLISIEADIYVERDGQKGIIIGKGGERLKTVGTEARHELEALLGNKVFLGLRVKVKKDWRGDDRILKELGFN